MKITKVKVKDLLKVLLDYEKTGVLHLDIETNQGENKIKLIPSLEVVEETWDFKSITV